LVPYNYLFDKEARTTTLSEVPWKNSVVIFDEAHNLEGFASDSASFDLSSVDVAACISELERVLGYQQSMPEITERISGDNLIRLKAIFLELEEYILQLNNDRNVFNGEFMMKILTEGARINHSNHAMFVNEAKKVSDILMDLRSTGGSKGQTKIDFFIGCVKCVYGEPTEGRCLAKASAYRVHVSDKTGSSKSSPRTVSYWCFAPSLAMQELADLNIRSVIVTSGTLSPLPSYSMELGIPFPHTLENPHIIADEQIHVRVIGHGVSGKPLSSAYNRRDDSDYLAELGSTIVNLARVVPGGMLIFFPSYSVMNNCIEAWGGPASRQRNFGSNNSRNLFFEAKRRQSKSNRFSFPHAPDYYGSVSANQQPVWKRLLCQKAIIMEPKTSADLADAIGDFNKYLNQPKSTGCILMGVCRGKISEGIDFAHDMCRAVVITGLPFPPFVDPKVKLKREYLDGIRSKERVKATGEGGFGQISDFTAKSPTVLSGMEWYTQQAHRAVNQAIGRVIRNKYDYGAVLLLDSRFGDPNNRNGLSKWVGSRLLPDEKFGIAQNGLVKFYREAKAKEAELKSEKRSAHAAVVQRVGVLLAYENDKGEEDDKLSTKKVAVVKSSIERAQSESENDTAQSDKTEADTKYIAKNQILGTITLEGKNLPQANKRNLDHVESQGLADIYKSKSTTLPSAGIHRNTLKNVYSHFDIKSKKASALPSATPAISSGQKSTAAQIFFSTAKQKLDTGDFVSLRKLLVTMKKVGDSSDSKKYLQAAGSLIDLLIRYDDIESQSDSDEQLLCSLLYPLLPGLHQRNVQKLALRKMINQSVFHEQCKIQFPQEQHPELYKSIFSSLKQIYCVPLEETFSKALFIQECTPVVVYLFSKGMHDKKGESKCNNSDEISLMKLFSRLLPRRHRMLVSAILDNVVAARDKENQKAREKAKEGENGIEKFRFVRTKNELSGHGKLKKEETEVDLGSQTMMQGAIMRGNEVNSAKRSRVETTLERDKRKVPNPYKSRLKAVKTQQIVQKVEIVAKTGSVPSIETQIPTVSNGLIKSNTEGFSKENDVHEDRVTKILLQAEASAFKKKRSSISSVRGNRNSSECMVCEVSCKKPYMAKCGHLACGDCWLQWLKKSSTCPVCRGPAVKNELARVVYENEPGSGIPSMSQLYSHCDSDSDLEIVH